MPGMQGGAYTGVVAIPSREASSARAAATALGIPKSHGSYEALLADPDVDAIYNPLPNHLHVPWTTRAAEAGKHVLCEKPVGLSAGDAQALIGVRDRTGVVIQEAFMVRSAPQWVRALDVCRSCLLYTSPSPRDRTRYRMPSSACKKNTYETQYRARRG